MLSVLSILMILCLCEGPSTPKDYPPEFPPGANGPAEPKL